MIIESRAPTRIDLAGGTVDIWPIFLMLDRPATLNLAIDLFAEAKLEESSHPGPITLRSEDQAAEIHIDWPTLESASAPPALELHLKLLRHFARQRGRAAGRNALTLSTRARSPAGAGLGGSSTLSIAMIGALATWASGAPVDPEREGLGERLIEIARDTETTVIRVPAGLQDYYGAMFGGLQNLRWLPGAHARERLPTDLSEEAGKRLLLFYSSQSRNSGINNWTLFKSFIDESSGARGGVRERFAAIVSATRDLEEALRKRDWRQAARSIEREWETRRQLATGITTPEIDAAFAAAREIAPDSSGKVCGAGGGGCFFIFVPSGDPGLLERLRDRIESLGPRSLPFQPVPQGLETRVTRA